MTSTLLSEDELALIDALQINPRASWATLGHVLGVDPATVARRWKRLSTGGHAWTTAALGQRQLHSMSMAFLQLDCEAGAAPYIADVLAGQPHLITVQHVAGSHDLWAIAVTASLPQLTDYLLGDLPRMSGVRNVRTHMATRVFDTSRRWRLRVLPKDAVNALRAQSGQPSSSRPMDSTDRRIYQALSVDGRVSYAELGEALGLSQRTVQRRLNRLLAAGDVDFRCDLARRFAGWHAAAVLWLDMPDESIETTGRELLTWNETRTCAAVAGPVNMMLTVGLHAVSDLHALVARLRTCFPHVRVADRQLVMRQRKLYGRRLDDAGRWVSAIPVDPWSVCQSGS